MTPERIDDGIWRWTARHPEWHPGEFGAQVASFAIDTGDETLLIDPLLGDGDDGSALDALVRDRVAILISVPYHTRSAEPLAERYDATIHGHRAVAKRLSSQRRFRPVSPGDTGPGDARFHAIGKPRRYEMPIWLPSHAAIVFGDAVAEVDGDLRLWAVERVDERVRRFYTERFNPTLEPLIDLGPERMLVTHGAPVLSGGADALRRAVERDPWYHHS